LALFALHIPDGGSMVMCASCQCYVSKGAESLPEMGEEEEAMLSEAFNTKD